MKNETPKDRALNALSARSTGQELKIAVKNSKLNKQIKAHNNNIKNLTRVLKGKKGQVLKALKKQMREASKSQEFERAATLRDQIIALESVFHHSHILQEVEGVKLLPRKEFHSFQALQKVLGLKTVIKRIEGYDVSNIQGKEATGSMVVFEKGTPNKNEYRKFRVSITGKPNDVAMLKEVLGRRLKHTEWPLPQVILIDGGIAQLKAGLKVKNNTPPVTLRANEGSHNGSGRKAIPRFTRNDSFKIIALAKRKNELFIEGKAKPVLLKNLPQEVANLILRIRDEAHRFAITYHKKLREKALIK